MKAIKRWYLWRFRGIKTLNEAGLSWDSPEAIWNRKPAWRVVTLHNGEWTSAQWTLFERNSA